MRRTAAVHPAERALDVAGYPRGVGDRIRWGILATGHIAGSFAADLRDAGGAIAAVASSSSLERAERFAAEHGIPRAHGSYAGLAADPDVDVVYIATPHALHARDAIACLEAGKHVLVEKAFTLNRAEAELVASTAAERGLLAQEAMWTRFLPHMRRIREIIAAGVLGELRTVIADHSQRLPSDPAHRLQDPALGGGALLDLGVYPVSFAWDLLGAPSAIRAVSTPTPTGVDAQTSVVLEYSGGAQALLTCGLDAAGTNRAAVVGTEARIEIDPVWFAPAAFRVLGRDGRVLERADGTVPGIGLRYEALAVEAAIAEGRTETPELPTGESVEIMGLLDEIRRQIGLRYPSEGSG